MVLITLPAEAQALANMAALALQGLVLLVALVVVVAHQVALAALGFLVRGITAETEQQVVAAVVVVPQALEQLAPIPTVAMAGLERQAALPARQ